MKRFVLIFMTLALLLGQIMTLVCFAAEQVGVATPANAPIIDSGTGDSIPLIPLVPAAPTEPLEVTIIWNKSLLTHNHILDYGDTAGLTELQEHLSSLFQGLAGLTADMERGAELVVARMDLEGIDVFTPGAYSVTALLKLHEDYADDFILSEQAATLTFHVVVADPDAITVFRRSVTSNHVNYCFSSPQRDGLTVWYAVTQRDKRPEEVAWQPCTDQEWVLFDINAVTQLCGIGVSREQLEPDKDYFFQLRGGALVSNVVKINPTTLVTDENNMGGDRDGNDNDDNTLDPPLTQPPPKPPITLPSPENGGDDDSCSGDNDNSGNGNDQSNPPSEPMPPPVTPPPVTLPSAGDSSRDKMPSEPTLLPVTRSSNENAGGNSTLAESTPPVMPSQRIQGSVSAMKPSGEADRQGYERVDGATTTISGARLLWLLERNAQFVPFGWNEVSLEVPVAFLQGLSLTSEDMLSMTLTRENELTFTLSIFAKGDAVTELESTLVRLPAPKPQHTYTLSLAGTVLETPVAYENGYAVFAITQTGTYQLTEEAIEVSAMSPSQPPKENETLPVLPEARTEDFLPLSVTGAAILLGGVFWLWRKRR